MGLTQSHDYLSRASHSRIMLKRIKIDCIPRRTYHNFPELTGSMPKAIQKPVTLPGVGKEHRSSLSDTDLFYLYHIFASNVNGPERRDWRRSWTAREGNQYTEFHAEGDERLTYDSLFVIIRSLISQMKLL